MGKKKSIEERYDARIWGYLTFEERRMLQVRLAAINMRTSEWIRNIVLQFIDAPMPDDIFRKR